MVKTGIDSINDFRELFCGKRIALCTGASGVAGDLRSDIEHFLDFFDISLLLAPEHGLRGELQPGQMATDFIDPSTKIRCVSLFGGGFNFGGGFDAMRRALVNIDIVAFDLQDAGSRYFTFASTLYYLMKACSEMGIVLAVLDRPNPLGGIDVEGNTQRDENLSFIGLTHVPIRHSLTMGELAVYFKMHHHVSCTLKVIPMTGWKRHMWYDDTGLFFTPPSPNLPTLNALSVYNGTCLFAGTNISEGRGTTEPFTLIGAPFVDGYRLAKRLNEIGIEGLRFAEAYFSPGFSKYSGECCGGVRLHITDKRRVNGVAAGVYMFCAIREMFPDFALRSPGADGRWHIDIASGTNELRLGELSAREICTRWEAEAKAFLPVRDACAIYAD